MTAEEAQALYYQEMCRHDWHGSSGKPLIQERMQLDVWDAVVQGIRAEDQAEIERLREENRTLKEAIANMIESDAKPRPVIWGAL